MHLSVFFKQGTHVQVPPSRQLSTPARNHSPRQSVPASVETAGQVGSKTRKKEKFKCSEIIFAKTQKNSSNYCKLYQNQVDQVQVSGPNVTRWVLIATKCVKMGDKTSVWYKENGRSKQGDAKWRELFRMSQFLESITTSGVWCNEYVELRGEHGCIQVKLTIWGQRVAGAWKFSNIARPLCVDATPCAAAFIVFCLLVLWAHL